MISRDDIKKIINIAKVDNTRKLWYSNFLFIIASKLIISASGLINSTLEVCSNNFSILGILK